MFVLMLACVHEEVGRKPTDTGAQGDSAEHIPGDSTHTGETGETGDTSETGETGDTVDTDTGESPYGCDNLPPGELEWVEMDQPRGYHDLVFDDAGRILGWDGKAMVAAPYTGDSEKIIVGLQDVQGMDRLFDGDYVAANSARGEVFRFTADGGMETITTGLYNSYGVTVGPDGMVYVATYNAVYKVDPESGEQVKIVSAPPSWYPHTINFSLDSTVMYIGTIGTGGKIYAQAMDADMNPTGDLFEYARNVGQGYHDGLGVDVCGNLYAADYSSTGLYRVLTDGTVDTLIKGKFRFYGHGLKWGSGIGGWRTDALYQPQPYDSNTVREVVIGVEDGHSVRTLNGVKVPYYTP